jgi:hypothetical protein
MTTQAELMDLMAAALVGQTAAGARVYTPRTWPTRPGDMPILLLTPGKEVKKSKGRSAPAFDVLAVVRVQGRVFAKSGVGDAGAIAALAAAELLKAQIEVALINQYDLQRAVQSIAQVETQVATGKDGEMVYGEVLVDFTFDFFQYADQFHPVDGEPLEELKLYGDLLNIFSALDDFTGAPGATPWVADALAAPRKAGPDGRAEIGLTFDFTTPAYQLDFSVAANAAYLPLV